MNSVLLSILFASATVQAAPDAPGEYAVGMSRLDLRDASRDNRRLTSDVWYPVARASGDTSTGTKRDAPCAEGAFPLVIFSHGAGATRQQSMYLTEHWASHGYVVVAPDHQFNTVFDNAGGLGGIQSGIDRPHDCSFVIDRMLERNGNAADRLYQHIDPQRIGATGHSFGGYTVMVLAGATVDAQEARKMFGKELEQGDFSHPDPRVRAVIAYAPVGPPLLSPKSLAEIKIPVMVFAGTHDLILPLEKHQLPLFESLGGPAFLATIEGGSHFCFNNAAFTSLARLVRTDKMLEEHVDRAVADVIVKSLSLAFLNRYVAGDESQAAPTSESAGVPSGQPPVLSLRTRNVETPAASRVSGQ
ncbi:MAG TPA: dienelactone hydrolase family protein [Pirellulales bacterium]|nr:dienelactone hydrolase family protein [Pirellulales bacterium]